MCCVFIKPTDCFVVKVNSLLPLLILVPALLPPPLLHLSSSTSITCRAMSQRLGCGWARPLRQSRHCTLSITWRDPGGWLATHVTTQTDVAPDWTAREKPKELTRCERWQLFWEDSTSITPLPVCHYGSPTKSRTQHGLLCSPCSMMDTQGFTCQDRLYVCPASSEARSTVWTSMDSDLLVEKQILSALPHRPVSSMYKQSLIYCFWLEYMNKAQGLRFNHGLVCQSLTFQPLWFVTEKTKFFKGLHHQFYSRRNWWTFHQSSFNITSKFIKGLSGICLFPEASFKHGHIFILTKEVHGQAVVILTASLTDLCPCRWIRVFLKDFLQRQFSD